MLQQEMKFRKIMGRGARPVEAHQRTHDLVFLKNVVSAKGLADMRVAEDCGECLQSGEFKMTPAQLDHAGEILRKFKKPLKLAVTADGRHFDRRDMDRLMTRELKDRGVRFDEDGRMLWLFLIDEKYYLVLQTAGQGEAPFRHFRKREREGSLPPTVAAALVLAARPEAGEIAVDYCCGSGTLLSETHGFQRRMAQLVGFDIDEQAVSVARTNVKNISHAKAVHRDGTQTELPDGFVNLALGNLPSGDTPAKPALYDALFGEMVRTSKKPGWRAALMVPDLAIFKSALQKRPELKYEELFSVKIRGEVSRGILVTFR